MKFSRDLKPLKNIYSSLFETNKGEKIIPGSDKGASFVAKFFVAPVFGALVRLPQHEIGKAERTGSGMHRVVRRHVEGKRKEKWRIRSVICDRARAT